MTTNVSRAQLRGDNQLGIECVI